jgi:hypothetical protein
VRLLSNGFISGGRLTILRKRIKSQMESIRVMKWKSAPIAKHRNAEKKSVFIT